MAYPNPSLCRVSLHTDGVNADLALPAEVSISALIPSVVDILAPYTGWQRSAQAPAPYRLSRPGAATLDSSKTLAQHVIRDGTVLLLTRTLAELPAPRFDDPAEQVSATVRARAQPWTPRATRFTAILGAGWLAGLGVLLLMRSNVAAAAAAAAAGAGCALVTAVLAHRVHRDAAAGLALALLAVGLAGLAGFVAVPDGPGAPNAVLAATAAAVVAMLAMQLAGCAGPVMTAVCCLAVLTTAAALAAVLTRVSPQQIGTLAAVASIGLLQAAARLSIALAGLSQRPGPPSVDTGDRTIRAHDLLTGLVAA
ncbi:MAG: type VII secretion integral membrane protein EccD, partial [Mycobacterium sp.]